MYTRFVFKHMRLCLGLLLCCLATLSLAANKIEAKKEELGDLKERIESLKKELDSKQEAHKDAADALKESETAISLANRKLREINQQHQQNKNALQQLKKQTLSIHDQLSLEQKQLGALLYQRYTQGNQSYSRLILESKNPSQIARDLKYQSYIAKAHAELINNMQGNLHKIKQLNEKTSLALQAVAALKAKQLEEQKALEAQKLEKSKIVKSLSKEISAQRNEIKKLSRDEKRLSDLVERLARVIPKPKKKTLKKSHTPSNQSSSKEPSNETPSNEEAEAPKPSTESVISNEQTPTDSYDGGNFAALRGKLRLPVRGDIVGRFGSKRADSGVSWKGLFIRSSEGSDVKSVAGGRVVFADWLRGFGNLIIVDHGAGYMSLYGNNQAVLKQVGEEVKGGDTIASVGNSGGNETSGLYYELRRQSKPFDPLSWSNLR
jgi:murein hydrolase activator